MLNQTVLVGRLTKDPEIVTHENGKKVSAITLAVQRAFKNVDGIYETDFIRCVLWNGIAENTCEYCHVGDVVGIKGRLQTSSYEDETGTMKYVTEVIAERVTFLTNKKDDSNK
jgi:single-strand DNA-binding protein